MRLLLVLSLIALGSHAAPATESAESKCTAAINAATNSSFVQVLLTNAQSVANTGDQTANQTDTAVRDLLRNSCVPALQADYRKTASDLACTRVPRPLPTHVTTDASSTAACTDYVALMAQQTANTTVTPQVGVLGAQLLVQAAYFIKDLACLRSPVTGELCAIEAMTLCQKYNVTPAQLPPVFSMVTDATTSQAGSLFDSVRRVNPRFAGMNNASDAVITTSGNGTTVVVDVPAVNGSSITPPVVPKEAVCTPCNSKALQQSWLYVNFRVLPLVTAIDAQAGNDAAATLNNTIAQANGYCGSSFVSLSNATLELGLLDGEVNSTVTTGMNVTAGNSAALGGPAGMTIAVLTLIIALML